MIPAACAGKKVSKKGEMSDKMLFERIAADNSGQKSAVVYAADFARCRAMLAEYNVRVIKEFPFISAFGVYYDAFDMREIAALQHVKNVVEQSKVYAQTDIARGIMNIGAMHKRGYYGAGVNLAVIDTGIYPHLDFMIPENRLVKFVDFLNGGEEAYDDNGHGTFVAGVALGNGLKSGGLYKGIAPHAGLVALRAMNKKGEGGAFGILEAMQWVYDNAEKYKIRVVCMSFGSAPIDGDDPLIEGAEALWRRGIVVIAAAGNNGPEPETIKSPGASSLIITAGAMDDGRGEEEAGDTVNSAQRHTAKHYKVAGFSSRGPVGNLVKPDIIAPGVDIISTSIDDRHFYSRMSGTSVAAPMVSGLACLLLESRPQLNPDQVKSILIRSAERILGESRYAQGYGLARVTE